MMAKYRICKGSRGFDGDMWQLEKKIGFWWFWQEYSFYRPILIQQVQKKGGTLIEMPCS